jgi:regulator of RNase E activity RraB
LLDDEDGEKIIPENITECFVYGYEVDDAHMLTKEYIYALNVSATQELYKIITEQQNQITELQNQIDMLKDILARNGIV